jgi:hypothetical protein
LRSTSVNSNHYSFKLPMKQLRTIQNDEIMFFVQSVSNVANKKNTSCIPGKHVLNNIMSYARSLQVLKKENGEVIMLTGN